METKRYFRYFTIADYEREQKWLNAMSRSGWNFVRTNGFIYTFEKGTPGEYIYKLDLPNESMTDVEVDAYYKFMEECGIEIVSSFKFWRYLRKKSADGPFDATNNTMTQLSMVNKAYGVATKTLCVFIVIFALLILALNIALSFVTGNVAEFISGVIYGIASSAFLAMAIIMVPIIQRLRTRMNELIDEIQIKG
ncbi:MAG: DUF2812 domain-containing protein [Muribaculaceae bacterium]|nr:DUF2812 domain-containing protein [Muribaculaceae bacterium]